MDYQSYLIEHPFDHVHGPHELIEHIKNNELKVLEMTHAPDDYFVATNDLIDALNQNESIEVVKFHDDFIGCLYGRRRSDVVEAIGKLPNLQSVVLGDSGLLIRGVIGLLKTSKTIKSLTLNQIVMQGLQKDFDDLEQALYRHPTLKSFDMKDCRPANEEVDLSPLLTAAESSAPTAPLPPCDPNKMLKRGDSAVAA